MFFSSSQVGNPMSEGQKEKEPASPFSSSPSPQATSQEGAAATGFAGTMPSTSSGGVFGNMPTDKPKGPPPLANTQATGDAVGTPPAPAPAPAPALKPQKEKKKGRKGLIVSLVILMGFVCGAALASFVLPVDEYVDTARAFLESKLNLGGEAEPIIINQPAPAAQTPPAAEMPTSQAPPATAPGTTPPTGASGAVPPAPATPPGVPSTVTQPVPPSTPPAPPAN